MNNRTPRLFFVILCLIGFLSSVAAADMVIGKSNKPDIPTADKSVIEQPAQQAASKAKTKVSDKQKTRGQMLYENHCQVCHESKVHIRSNRKAKSTGDIGYWVTRWSSHLKLKWTKQDITDVINHINSTYYKFSN